MIEIPGIPAPYSSQIIALFRNLPASTEVILFGSRAKGNFREGSDIDIALKGAKTTLGHRDEVLLNYERLQCPWKLDVVVYRLVNEPELRKHIDRIGIKLVAVP